MKIIILCSLYWESSDLLINPMIQLLVRIKFSINFLIVFHPMHYITPSYIYNDTWASECFPPYWREAIVIPFPKSGKDNSNPANYRFISVTSCLFKTVERMINDRLVWFFETNYHLSNIQCGFRPNRCTIDHTVRLVSYIHVAFARKEHVVTGFSDLEKAYETTWQYGILQHLYQFGFQDHFPLFIQHFYFILTAWFNKNYSQK